MRKSSQILLLQARLKRAEWVLQCHQRYLKEHDLENDYDEWFWSEPESG